MNVRLSASDASRGKRKAVLSAVSFVLGAVGVGGLRDDIQNWANVLGVPASDVIAVSVIAFAALSLVLIWLPRTESQPHRLGRTGISATNSNLNLKDVSFKNVDRAIDATNSKLRGKRIDIE